MSVARARVDFTRPEANRRLCDFQTLGADTIPLTETRTVKFRQVFQHVPVYGSLVTVEMDEDNELISLNSSMGTPEGVSPVARIAPEHAVEVAPQHLSRTSGFLDSRRGVELAARSLLRRDPMKNRKIDALGRAFDDVGICRFPAGFSRL